MAGRGATTGRVVAGGVLVLVGLLFLLASITDLDIWGFLGTFWPLLLIGFGAWATYSSKGRNLVGIIVLFLGLGFQLATLDVIDDGWLKWGWAVIVIIIGLWLVLFRPFPGREKGQEKSDWTDMLGMFAGPKVHVTSQAWKGGEVTVLFGGAELDLRDALPQQEGANLEVTAVFGGVEVFVPRSWVVDVKGTPILGSVDDHTVVSSETDEAQDPSPLLPRLNIRATAIFGGIDIKN
jgi:hypothetical protein